MPFTLCHPAIVLPLHRRAGRMFVLAALVIGSMTPDFVYFLSLGVAGSFSHSVPGIFMYCVPAGLLMYVAYYALLREPCLACLPQAVSARMTPQPSWTLQSWRVAGLVVISLAIGAASHVFWDGFTHRRTMFVDYFVALQSQISIGEYEIAFYRLLQHLSTLVGFIVIAAYLRAWFKRTTPVVPPPATLSMRHKAMAMGGVAAAGLGGAAAGVLFKRAISFEQALYNGVVGGMAAAALTIALLCVGWQVNARRRAAKVQVPRAPDKRTLR